MSCNYESRHYAVVMTACRMHGRTMDSLLDAEDGVVASGSHIQGCVSIKECQAGGTHEVPGPPSYVLHQPR